MTLPPDAKAIVKDERVRALFKQEIEKYAGAFKGFESIQDFTLIAEDFTTDNGMLTPSLRLKRRKVIETYGPAIEQLYAARGDKAKKASAGARA